MNESDFFLVGALIIYVSSKRPIVFLGQNGEHDAFLRWRPVFPYPFVLFSNSRFLSFSMQVRIVTTESELISLKESWNRLVHCNSGTDYAFCSWEWFYHSWNYTHRPGLFVVTVFRDDRLIGLLPLVMFSRKVRGISSRQLAFCVNANTPRNSIYVDPNEAKQEIFDAIFEKIFSEKKQWDILRLADVDRSTAFYDYLLSSHSPCRFLIQTPSRISPYVKIDDYANFDEHLLKNVSQRRRTKLRRDIKRLDDSENKCTLVHYDTSETFEKGLELLMNVRKLSWKSKPTERFRVFFESICKDPYFADKVHIAVLLLGDDTPIAAQFYLIKNGCSQMILNDHDEAYHGTLVPGSNLTTLMLMYAFEQRWSFFDFSGDAYEYKKRLASGVTDHSSFQIFHHGWKSRMIYHGKKHILPLIRKILFPSPASLPNDSPKDATKT